MVARGVGAKIAFNSGGGADAWIMLTPLGANVLATVDSPDRLCDDIKNFAR